MNSDSSGHNHNNRTTGHFDDQNIHEYALSVEHVSKDYMLGTVSGTTFREAIRDRWKKESIEDKQNRQFTALNDVSFSVKKGETIGLIGPNGAGKSTLLKLISRVTVPTRGAIRIHGRVSSLLEVGTGFHQELTGLENIYLNGSILGMTKKEIDSKLDAIIDFSECREFLNTPVKRYSSGMYVKLAFSVAAHLDSEILIMDEVLAVGDLAFQTKCLNKMRDIACNEGRTIIYVSHNMDTIQKLCDRCLLLNRGELVYDGDVQNAIAKYCGDDIREDNYMDLSLYLRPGWLGRHDIRLTYAEYPERKNNVIKECVLPIRIKWSAESSVSQVGIRVELLDENTKPFATSVFYPLFHCTAGETGETLLQVDLSKVMNGNYSTYYTVFCLDAYGNNVDLDCVRGLNFSVERQENDIPMKWEKRSWGNIRLQMDE